jgi:hypothetical protein
MDSTQSLAIEPLTELHRGGVAKFSGQSDGFFDYVVRGEKDVRQMPAFESREDLSDTLVVLILRRGEGKQEARVEEDHFRGRP